MSLKSHNLALGCWVLDTTLLLPLQVAHLEAQLAATAASASATAAAAGATYWTCAGAECRAPGRDRRVAGNLGRARLCGRAKRVPSKEWACQCRHFGSVEDTALVSALTLGSPAAPAVHKWRHAGWRAGELHTVNTC